MTDLETRAAAVELLALDVDGVLTDGRLWFGDDGAEYKAFHVRDGHGLVALGRAGVRLAVISGRRSSAVDRRMAELGIAHVHQGVGDKPAVLAELLERTGISAERAAFIGDDEPDLAVMRKVGLPIAVADAHPLARAAAAWVTTLPGGLGAVREACDLILDSRRRRAEPR